VKLLKSKGLKLYCFSVIVRDGDHEYLSPGVVRARDLASAKKKAFEKAKRFLDGSKMRWSSEHNCFEPADGAEYRIVKVGAIYETTPEEVIRSLMWKGRTKKNRRR
jgi:hypothetical protein